MGHAGSDVESAYRPRSQVLADYARDPLLGTARLLVDQRVLHAGRGAGDVRPGRCRGRRRRRAGAGAAAADQRRGEVMAPIAPHDPDRIAAQVTGPATRRVRRRPDARAVAQPGARRAARDRRARAGLRRGRRPQGRGVRRDPRAAQAVRRGPGVRHAARRAERPRHRAGPGAAGLLPVPEIQYLAYLHNAADQLRGEAATLGFFSNGRLPQPDGAPGGGVRLPEGVRRPLPQRRQRRPRCATSRGWSSRRPRGPTTPPRCCAPAPPRPGSTAGSACSLEPIALYHRRDLHEPGDDGWLAAYPEPAAHVPIGSARAATATAPT